MHNGTLSDTQEVITPGLEPFVSTFFVDRKNDFANLKTYIDDNNMEQARKLAHNWKGYCEPYGFGHLGVMAAELEKAIAANSSETIKNLLLSMELYLANKKLPSHADN